MSDTTAESNPIDWSHGLSAINGGTITANNVTATGTGVNSSHGVHAEGAGSHVDFTGGSASASGANSNGVSVRSGGSATLTGTAVHSSGSVGAGVRAINAGSTVTFSDVNVSTTGYASNAMLSMDGATMAGSGARLDTTGDFSDGVHVIQGSQFRGTRLEIHTTGEQARGVATGDAGSVLSITDSTILTEGPRSHGARAREGAVLEIIDTQVTTLGVASKGVEFEGGIGIIKGSSFDSTGHALDVWAAGQADVLDSSFITALDSAYGMRVMQDGRLTVGNSRITTGGRDALGVTASTGGHAELVDTTIETTGSGAHGISATAGGSVSALRVDVTTHGSGAAALLANGAGSSISHNGGTLAVTGTDASSLVVKVGGAATLANTLLSADQGAAMQVDGDATIELTGVKAWSGTGLLLASDDSASAVGSGTVHFQASASELHGDIAFGDAYASTVQLGEGTLLRGSIQYVDDLKLGDSRWDMTGDSLVGNLSAHNSTIAFNHADGAFKTLTVTGDYVGDNALLQMNTVLGDDNSSTDRLHVLGSTAGETGIAVNNIGGPGALTHDGIRLVQVDGASNGNFNLVGRAVGGAYEYFLHKGGVTNPTDGDWYLRSGLPVAPIDECEANPQNPACFDPPVPTPVVRPEAGAYLANQAAAVGMFDLTMHERVGEPNLAERQKTKDQMGGAWARVTSEHTRGGIGEQLSHQGRQNLLQIGADLTRWGRDDRGVAGVMVGTGESTERVLSAMTGYGAEGRVKGRAAGVYATWLKGATDDGGLYVDTWAQVARYRNTVQGDALVAERYDSRGTSASVEAGYAFNIHRGSTASMYLEPQAQVIWSDYRMDGGHHVEANGTDVSVANAGGLRTRVGVRLFGHTTMEGVNRVQPFAALNWLHAHGSANAVQLDSVSLQGAAPRDVYEAKGGVQLQLGRGLTAWGELSIGRGAQKYQNYGALMGVKYAW